MGKKRDKRIKKHLLQMFRHGEKPLGFTEIPAERKPATVTAGTPAQIASTLGWELKRLA